LYKAEHVPWTFSIVITTERRMKN